MKSVSAFVLGVALSLSVVGCRTAPIYNVEEAPVVVSTGKRPSIDDIQRVIIDAGTSRGWNMRPGRPGLVVGTYALREHLAVVEITYDPIKYSITYRDSVELNYSGDKIHPNYNAWIRNLDTAIRASLLAL